MNYPEDHVEKRTTLYEAIAESNPINVQDNYTYQGGTPTTQTSTYVRESVSTYNTTPVSVSQRRATRPLGIPTHPTEIHSTSQYSPGSIQTTEEQILTRHVPMGNYEPDAVYKDETNITPLTRSVPPTASKTEKVERVVRASPGTTSTIVSSQPITTTPVVQSQNRVVYEQPLYAGNVIRIINPGEKVVEQQHTTTPVVYSSNYGQPVSTTTSVIRPQTVVYKEKAVASPTTRVIRQEEIIHETLPSPIEVKQSKVVLPVVKEFETIDNQFASQNISEIHPIGGSPYLKDSPRQAASPQNSLPQMNQVNQWESPIADLSQLRHENHQSFENWEANRNRFVNDRLNVMNDLISGMERTLDWLDVGVSKVILFFKEREAQELEYTKTIKHGLTQVGTHFDRSDHPEIMGNFSSVLKENDAFHAQDRKNSEILGMYIRKDILDWILVPNEKNYKHQADALLGSLHSSKKKLNHTSSKRQKAYNKYFKTYDSITKHGKASTKQDNLFRRQLKYSLAAREELRMLRLYNDQGLNAINEFSKMAPQRLQEVQKAYSLYLEKYSELYRNSSDTPSPVLHLINQTSGPDAVHSLFTVRTMTTPHNYQFLADNMKIYNREIIFEDLNPFLVNFPESIDPARSAFVIREWNAVKVSRILKNKACYVIATKNKNIIIIEKRHEEQETGKVKAPMHLGLTNVEEITSLEDGSMVKVVERVPGTLFTHKTKAKLKFETSNDAQEFMEYVNSQTTQTGGIV